MHQGRIADRYLLLHTIGTGGMGRVWLAHDETLRRPVAVKQVVPPAWMTPDERDELRYRTLREARTAARLNHPNVVRVYDVVHDDDSPWIVMEYVPSRSVQQVLETDGPLSPVRTAEVGLAVLAALRAAHASGVLHRDVKPHNVLIADDDGRVVLTDFGLATVDGGDGALTRDGVVLGSPQYVSPERAADGASTVESDLWSLGATLYAAVEGRSPYRRATTMATLTALAVAPPDPTRLAGPLRPVLAGLLRRDPRQRLTADEVERLLRRITDPPPRSGRHPFALARSLARRPPTPPTADRPVPEEAPADPPVERPQPSRRRPPNQRPQPDERPQPNQRAAGDQSPRPTHRGRKDQYAAPDRSTTPAGPADLAAPGDRPRPAGAGVPGRAGARPPHPVSGARRAPERQPDLDRPEPPGRNRRRRRPGGRVWRIAAAALALTLLAGLGTELTLRAKRAGESTPDTPGSRSMAEVVGAFPCAPPPERTVPVTAAPRPPEERFGLVDNWTWYTDASGFRIAVPIGWHRYTDGGVVCFREPVAGTGRMLSIDPSTPPTRDGERYWLAEERRLTGAGLLAGYEQVGIGPLDIRAGGAIWECRWTNKRGDRVQIARMLINTSPGRAYTVSWLTREFDWGVNQSYLRMVQTSFRPVD
ncbi:protein kinase [Micromonosporaceae bacterium B7E4]